MEKYSYRTFKFTILMAAILMLSLAPTKAFAGTLTETLRKFFNNDIGDFSQKMKLDTLELMPIRVVHVKGDAAKFRALNWMDDGVTGGIKDMTFNGDIGNGNHLSFESHAIPGDNDVGANLNLTKGNGGYITLDYGNFRKWYDVYGGYFSDFFGTSISKMTVDPKLDIGHFNLEIGSNPDNKSAISLGYQRNTKDGIKSRLSWGAVTENTRTKKIGPSWQDIGTATDALELKGKLNVAGFDVQGKQKAEFYSGRTMRQDDGSASVERTSQEPQTKQLVSSLKADRWTADDKTYVGFGYQFQHLTSDTLETITAYSPTTGLAISDSHNGVITGQASRDSHSWVQHLSTNLTPNLTISSKLKEEVVASTGSGERIGFLGGSNRADRSENQVMRTGQSVSLRYSGLPKTSLYTDWDYQQSRSWNSKERVGSSVTEYLDGNPEITGVMGVRYTFNSKFNLTSNFRKKSDRNTYDIFQNTDTGVAISRIQTESDEWSNRLTWKPNKWFQNSFRLQLLDTVYRTQSVPSVDVNRDWIKSNANSRIYSYDMTLQPSNEWMFNAGASLTQSKVSTPAAQKDPSAIGIPVFVSNVYTLLFSTSYVPKENLSLYGSAQYSRANDFDSHSFYSVPYGPNNEYYDLTVGMKWSPKKDFSIEPHFGYYVYHANPNDNYSLDYGNYSAQIYWLDTKFNW